jgi:hypothetical protein
MVIAGQERNSHCGNGDLENTRVQFHQVHHTQGGRFEAFALIFGIDRLDANRLSIRVSASAAQVGGASVVGVQWKSIQAWRQPWCADSRPAGGNL